MVGRVTAPVRLSRERWGALTRGGHPDYERVTILINNAGTPQMTKRAIVTQPFELAGIVFLPAEYVPPADPVRPETWWQRAYK